MAGLAPPWASRDDAMLWLTLLGLAVAGALALAAAALAAWALLLQPVPAWWRGGGWHVATDAATWRAWLRGAAIAAIAAALLALLFLALLALYSDGMLRAGKAEP